MKDWFTVEKIDEDTYAISEYQHWAETHCYLLCGTKRALLIDTGLGVANIKEVVDKLTMLPIFVVTTHVHWDHIGGHQYFENIGVHIWKSISYFKEMCRVRFLMGKFSIWENERCKLFIPRDIHRDITAFRFQQIWQTGLKVHAEN